jgi:hypothetical protein
VFYGHGANREGQLRGKEGAFEAIMLIVASTGRLVPAGYRPNSTQAVWKPMDYNAAHDRYPQRAFGCLCGHHSDDEKVSLSDAFQTSLRALFQDLRGAQAPTRRIAFIVFLNPRILSTRVRL